MFFIDQTIANFKIATLSYTIRKQFEIHLKLIFLNEKFIIDYNNNIMFSKL